MKSQDMHLTSLPSVFRVQKYERTFFQTSKKKYKIFDQCSKLFFRKFSISITSLHVQ